MISVIVAIFFVVSIGLGDTPLLAVIAYGLFRTGRSTTASLTTPGGALSQAAHGSAIDQTPLDTARGLVQMSTSADELPLA